MSKSPKLTLAYLQHAPEAAARVLQSLPDPAAVAFLETVPARISAPVVDLMIPWQAARYLTMLTSSRAALVLRQLNFSDATSLARLIDGGARAQIFEELPGGLARRIGRALEYPQHQVGAWIDADVPVVRLGDSVRDAQQLLQSAGTVSHVFLESEKDGEYVGVLSIQYVLHSDPNLPLEQIGSQYVTPLSNRASLSSVSFDERWDNSLHIPVVGRRNNVLGGLSRRSLRRALHDTHKKPDRIELTLFQHLLAALWVSCAGLFSMTAELSDPGATPARGAKKG